MRDLAVNLEPDFERYAMHALHVEERFAFPAAFRARLHGHSGTFLDLGCGDGAVLRSALEQGLLAPFQCVIGADISRVRIARLLGLELPGVRALVTDASPLPLPPDSVDVILSHQLIEHVPDDCRLACEIARVLKPGGIAFVTSVAKRWYGWYFYRCNGKFTLDPTHVREYRDVGELAARFKNAGLTVASAVERPLSHPLDKIALRVLTRSGVVRPARASAFYRDDWLMRALRGCELQIPGYRYAEVLSEKR